MAHLAARLRLYAAFALTALISIAARLGGQTAYTIGPNVRVTRADSGQSVLETWVCTDPQNSRHLLAAAIIERQDTTANAFFASFDSGSSWTKTLSVDHSVDPSCAISPDGITFAASVHDSMPSGASYLSVRRSLDGGRTWAESTVHDNMRGLDRAYVTTGERGKAYVHAYVQATTSADGGRGPAVAVLYSSSDSGRTFDRAAILPGSSFKAPWFFPANGVTTSDGTFIGLLVELDNTQRNMFRGRSDSASAPHALNAELRVIRWRDADRTVVSSHVASAYYDWRVPQLSMSSLAIDRTDGPFRGRLYAVWPDARYGRRTQILLSRSDDNGTTWTAPRIVSDDGDTLRFGPNNFMPMAAVNSSGVVAISWYDRRDNVDSLSYWPRIRGSLDGGDSWLPSIRVSSEPNRLMRSDRHLNGGDTSGLAADAAGRFHAVWIDNRGGTEHAWTATIEVHGSVQRRRR